MTNDGRILNEPDMVTSHYHRIVAWGERGVLFLLALYLCVHTMPRAWGSLITDFPSYYMSARLVHEGYDTSRMYEWTWMQREKDHRGVDVRITGLLPITPFSTLVMEPLAGLAPLAAKHIWILVNLALLVPIGWMLRTMTGLSLQRIALVFALSFPLHRNLLFGQFYVVLLLLIVAACCAYLRGYKALAGALVALAAACKIFPILLFVFFLQRKEWRALIGGLVTGLAAIALSIMVFGFSVHRTYLYEILPWTLHGEGLQPYVAGASFSGVLHYLFLSEPQWNPQPWHSSPLCYALLLPALQMMVFAPAVLLIRRDDSTRERKLLECSALLTASLAISTIPASYNFVLMVLPVCVLAALLLRRERYGWLAVLLIVYLGIGFPLPGPPAGMGPAVLLYLPRLPLMVALLFGIYAVLLRDRPADKEPWKWTYYAWSAAMAVSVVFSGFSMFRLERDARQEYAYRLALKSQGYLNSDPMAAGARIRYIAFTLSGYHLVTEDPSGSWSDSASDLSDDDLSFAVGPATSGREAIWVEQALSQASRIVDMRRPSDVVENDAREPMLSTDSQSLAFIRDDHGRGRLMVRRGLESTGASETALTPASLNVYEASFHSERQYAFSAVERGRPPQIYLNDASQGNVPLELGESRYPAISPDERWMAYSHLDDGMWNLWIRDQKTGAIRRIAELPCNQIQPSWEDDSKTLLYSTDCGRSLWFTAISRRRVVP